MQYINPTGLGEVQLMKLFTNDEEAFTHALHWGLLSDGTECELCGQAKFEIIPDASAKYGIRVYCPFCNVKRSILHNTVFMHSKLPICTILHLLFCWSQRQMPGLVAFNLGIAETTVTNFFKTFRDACVKYYRFRSRKIGGTGFHVQIDETEFVKRKANVGRIPSSNVWVFGGICYETNEVFAEVVPDRTSSTLFRVIQEHVNDFTVVTSDGWSAYHGLSQLCHYSHFVVNHKRNFINPLNGANTQKIERFWRDLKKSQKLYHGISRDEVDSHVAEAVWRKNRNVTLENSFIEAIELIRQTHYN